MNDIIHIRIDDRLLHGQVVTFWSNSLKTDRIMVANDALSKDEMQKTILRAVVPSGMRTSLIDKKKAATNILANKYAGQRVMLILKNPADALELMDLGLDIKEINVGNMANRPNTTQIKRSISVTDEEVKDFKELLAKGVKLTARMVPDDADVELIDYLNKAGL